MSRDFTGPLERFPPDFRNDVVFVGHYEPDGRVETLNYLARQGVSVRVFGPLWDNRASLDPVLRQSTHPRCLWRGLRQGHRGRQDRARLPVRAEQGRVYEALFRDPGLRHGNGGPPDQGIAGDVPRRRGGGLLRFQGGVAGESLGGSWKTARPVTESPNWQAGSVACETATATSIEVPKLLRLDGGGSS